MNKSFLDNTFLIERLINKDEKAYAFLVDTHYKDLFVYILSLTNDHELSQDIVQNVFIKTWEYRKKLNSSYSIKSFLYKSAYNEFINKYHRNKAISNLEKIFIEDLNSILDYENENNLKEKIDLVYVEIEKLPKKCKQVFLLSKKEGLTNLEIANYLNTSIKSVEAHITKGFSIIRKGIKTKNKVLLFLLNKVTKTK